MNVQSKIEPDTLYERDFHAWLEVQARLLRGGEVDALDLPNLLEEIESLGKSELSQVRSRLTVILEHLLKCQFALNRNPSAGWRRTLLVQRDDLGKVLKDSPSLKPRVTGLVPDAFTSARKRALVGFEEHEGDEMAHYRRVLPLDCPYTVEQILDEDWLPDHAA